jgi:hypothetical protein
MKTPSYSTRSNQHYLEVLRNGKPFEYGPNFKVNPLTMSQNEAAALLGYKEIIEQFLRTGGAEPPLVKKYISDVDQHKWAIERQASFQIDGTLIREPYLVLSYIKKSLVAHKQLGFGLDKATGLLEVWADIEAFVDQI